MNKPLSNPLLEATSDPCRFVMPIRLEVDAISIEIGGLVLHITNTGESVVVDIYDSHQMNGCVASTWALYSEATSQLEGKQ